MTDGDRIAKLETELAALRQAFLRLLELTEQDVPETQEQVADGLLALADRPSTRPAQAEAFRALAETIRTTRR